MNPASLRSAGLTARATTSSTRASQPFSLNQTGTLLRRYLAQFVAAVDKGNRWYLFADPMASPVYVYGYLNGAEGPQVSTGPVSGVDGVEVSVIFDFGVGAIDWRGAWFNPGT
jgi:hypothetical protein